MPQTIVIGIGGTGLDIIRCLRRRIVENHGSVDYFRYLRFLFIDTDNTSVDLNKDNKKRWQVLGKDTFLDPAEYCLIGVREPGAVLRNLSLYKQVEPWFPADNLEGIEQTARNNPGASQIRPLGRLGFVMNSGAIETKFRQILNGIPPEPGGGPTHVHLACSLSGGTGSGSFLDLAYKIRRWTGGNCETYGFLVLPSLTEDRGERYLANAYASLLELNYYNLSRAGADGREKDIEFHAPLDLTGQQEPPFDNCYLISPRNSAPVALSLEGVAEMIAHRLYLNLDQAVAGDAAGLMSNARAERTRVLRDPFTGDLHSQNFSTFGLSSIQYPVEQVTEILAYRLADEVFYAWVKPRIGAPQNVPDRVKADFSELLMSGNHTLGDLDLFGAGNNYSGIPVEAKEFVTRARQESPRKRMAAFMSERYGQFATQFRNSGVTKYYQGLLDKLPGAVNVIAGRVRQKVANLILDGDLGYPFAHDYMAALIKLLDDRSQEYARQIEGLPARLTNSRTALNGALNQLNEADNSIVFREKKVQDAMQRVTQGMESNLIALAETAAYNYGSQLLGALDDRLKQLRVQLDGWKDAVERLRNSIQDEIRSRQDFLSRRAASTAEFNGAILFRDAQIPAMYGELNIEQASAHVLQGLLGEGKDPIAVIEAPEHATSLAYESALDWLGRLSAVRVTSKNVADRLLEAYPDSREADRIKLLGDNLRNSMPFLDFDETEMAAAQHDDGVGYRDAATKHARIVALMSDEQNKFPAVAKVRDELVRRVGLQPAQLKQITGTSEILFLQEAAAFPMRLIRDLKMLRDAYQKLLLASKPLPLHVDKSFDPPLQNLFLTGDQERRQYELAEEDFLVGWVEGRLRVERNSKEERDEVRYRYRESGADKAAALGLNWEEAFQAWTHGSPELAALRTRLADENRRFRDSLDSVALRRQFSTRLAAHLDKLKAELPHGEENDRYRRYSAIRERIFTSWHLPEPEEPDPASAAANQG